MRERARKKKGPNAEKIVEPYPHDPIPLQYEVGIKWIRDKDEVRFW